MTCGTNPWFFFSFLGGVSLFYFARVIQVLHSARQTEQRRSPATGTQILAFIPLSFCWSQLGFIWLPTWRAFGWIQFKKKKAPQWREQSCRETGAGWCGVGFFFNRCSETPTWEQRKIGQGKTVTKLWWQSILGRKGSADETKLLFIWWKDVI